MCTTSNSFLLGFTDVQTVTIEHNPIVVMWFDDFKLLAIPTVQ